MNLALRIFLIVIFPLSLMALEQTARCELRDGSMNFCYKWVFEKNKNTSVELNALSSLENAGSTSELKQIDVKGSSSVIATLKSEGFLIPLSVVSDINGNFYISLLATLMDDDTLDIFINHEAIAIPYTYTDLVIKLSPAGKVLKVVSFPTTFFNTFELRYNSVKEEIYAQSELLSDPADEHTIVTKDIKLSLDLDLLN